MGKFMADLHIHSVLSPCGSLEMSPKNIVLKAKELGIHMISLTDHNSIENSLVTKKLAEKFGLYYIYGMEVQTSEEIHILTYFDSYEELYNVWKVVYENLPNIKNEPELLGDQVVVDEEENIIKFEEKMLLNSTSLSLKELNEIVKKNNGLLIPAHVDSEAFSLTTQIGFIPEELEIKFVEISINSVINDFLIKFPQYSNLNIVSFSDAHFLKDIGRVVTLFEIDEPKVSNIYKIDNKSISILRRLD